MIRDEALKVLGLPEGSDPAAVIGAFAALSAGLAQKCSTAPNPTLRAVFEQQAVRLREARDLLLSDGATRPPANPLSATKLLDIPSLAPIQADHPGPEGRDPGDPFADLPSSIPGSPLNRTKLLDLPAAGPVFASGPFGANPAHAAASLGIMPGRVLADRYEILATLGAGGMGAVFSVKDRLRGEEIAIKVLLPHLLADPKARERFLNEAKVAGDLAHPNIVRVYDVHETEGLTFLTMELLKGKSLRDEIVRRGREARRFGVAEVVAISGQLCDALQTAHKVTVHRDVKPENVWLCEDGSVKLMDFGIARLLRPSQFTSTGMALGTAYYMAPEQLRGQDVDHRADQYAMGVMLYELLTGEVPQGAIRAPRQVRKSVPPGMSEAVMKALAGDPQRRFADMAALHRAASSRSGLGFPSRVAILSGIALALGAALTAPTWWSLLVATAEGEKVGPSSTAEANDKAKDAYRARRPAVEALKKEAESVVARIEADGLQPQDEVAERSGEIWRRHLDRHRWMRQADDRLKGAASSADKGSFQEALADLEAAEADYLKPKAWQNNAREALESAEKTRLALQQKLGSMPRESSVGLVEWPEALVGSIQNQLAQGEGEAGKAEADRIAQWLPQADELLAIRRKAGQAAKEGKDGQNVASLRDRYTAALERLRLGDAALKGDHPSEARRHFLAARDELILVRDEVNDRVEKLALAGRERLKSGAYADAATLFDEVLKARPDDPDAARLRRRAEIGGQLALIRKRELAGRPDEAATLLADLRRKEPDDPEVKQFVDDTVAKAVNGGNDALRREDFDTASALFQRLRNLRPDVEVARQLARVRDSQKAAADRDQRIADERRERARLDQIAEERREQDRLDQLARDKADRIARENAARRAEALAQQQQRDQQQDDSARRGRGNPNSHTFGGLGVPAQGGGIFLTGSVPNTPAAALGLEYGDVIVSINGTSVNTQAEYVRAVHDSPDTMNFVLRNVRTGQLQRMTTQLSRPN